MKRLPTTLLMCALALPLLSPVESLAQRRVIGADDAEEEDDDDREDKKAKEKKEADEKAGDAAREKATKEAERKEAEEEAKEAAAEKAAEEAERKAEEAELKAAAEAEAKEQAKKDAKEKRLGESRAARLKSAKKMRILLRDDEKIRSSITLAPGFVKEKKLVEINFDLSEKLAVASARYGNLKPMNKLALIATLKSDDGTTTQHRVHSTGRPGGYGFHFTPQSKGVFTLTLESMNDGKLPVSFELPVRVGEWPPEDFDDEEKAMRDALSKGTGSGSRVILGG